MSKCPVDHVAQAAPPEPQKNACPVAHDDAPATPGLGRARVTSSIPRADGGHWEYPSEAQFYAAMARKQHNPRASDMGVVVPIHNAVNERAWAHVLDWEQGRGGDKCGGVKLVSFMGKPKERSPRAQWRILLGYQPPFDRHDWIVDRCGVRMRYVIDFYTGKGSNSANPQNLSFYLDCRPALDSWEGIKMRTGRFFSSWLSRLSSSPSSPPTTPNPKAQ